MLIQLRFFQTLHSGLENIQYSADSVWRSQRLSRDMIHFRRVFLASPGLQVPQYQFVVTLLPAKDQDLTICS